MKNLTLVLIATVMVVSFASCENHVCAGPDCQEICDDGKDNDDDGFTDCNDQDCASDPACEDSNNNTNRESNCNDDIDNDGDGDIDCKDSDCADLPVCDPTVPKETVCDDGIDNDQDGDADCDDSDCADLPVCDPIVPKESICDDGIDNDGDGLTDCDDPNCANSGLCETICDDSIDNDGDGLTDCFDPECENASNCINVQAERLCGDGFDNDGDGYVDCDDHDCVTSMECTGEARFTDLLGMYPGEGTIGGCMNPLEPGDWDPSCAGPVVMGNFHVIGDETLWAVAYNDQEACTAAGIRAYGIHYDRFQISVVDAPGGDFISADVICHAICGPQWETDGTDKAQVNIACFYRSDSAVLFNTFDSKVDDHDQSIELDMTRVILRRPAEK